MKPNQTGGSAVVEVAAAPPGSARKLNRRTTNPSRRKLSRRLTDASSRSVGRAEEAELAAVREQVIKLLEPGPGEKFLARVRETRMCLCVDGWCVDRRVAAEAIAQEQGSRVERLGGRVPTCCACCCCNDATSSCLSCFAEDEAMGLMYAD